MGGPTGVVGTDRRSSEAFRPGRKSRQAARSMSLRGRSWRITRNWGLTAEGLIEGAHAADRARGRSRVMNRRTFLCGLMLGTLAAPLVGEAQQTTKVTTIGYLSGPSLSANAARIEAFRQGLRELSYVEGKNIVIEW